MNKRFLWRFLLALVVGVAIPFLPMLLTQSVGPDADLSGRLTILAGGVSAGTFAVLFLGGVLTSLTPCVYPLIPITVGVFGARQAERRSKAILLTMAYVVGMGLVFSALGVVAAKTGQAFGSILG